MPKNEQNVPEVATENDVNVPEIVTENDVKANVEVVYADGVDWSRYPERPYEEARVKDAQG